MKFLKSFCLNVLILIIHNEQTNTRYITLEIILSSTILIQRAGVWRKKWSHTCTMSVGLTHKLARQMCFWTLFTSPIISEMCQVHLYCITYTDPPDTVSFLWAQMLMSSWILMRQGKLQTHFLQIYTTDWLDIIIFKNSRCKRDFSCTPSFEVNTKAVDWITFN